MVDDVISVTESGFKSCELNSYINTRAAVKTLQFNEDKCKVMFVGKNKEPLKTNVYTVDKWRVNYKENTIGGHEMDEHHEGEAEMGYVEKYKYLGHTISNTGNNMENINVMKKNSIGIIQKIFNILNIF